MIKTRKILAGLLALAMMLTVFSMAAAEQEARKIETPADADEWIRAFLGEHPEEMDGVWQMTVQMQKAAAASGGMKGLAASLATLGKAEKISSAYAAEIQGYPAYHIPCIFTNMSVDLVLITDQGAVAGLTTGVYTGETEAQADADTFVSAELALPVPALNGELPGTLTLPEGDGPFPAVVLIHGSGPNDRDETVGNLKPFRDLAEGLTKQGIAVYRFDKRTYVYGTVMAGDHQVTLTEESIEDAAAAVQLLAQQEKIDSSRIFVLGHSLGGNVIPAIDQALKDQPVPARGYIMMAASPRPLDELMREQYDFLYSLLPEITEEQQAEKDAMFSELDKLKELDSMTDDDTIAGVYTPYWKWLAAYDALSAAEGITEPVLLLQGEEDYQVTMEDYAIWEKALGDRDNWTLISYPGLTHPFTAGQKTEGAAAYLRSEKVDGKVIQDIADFINRIQ